MGVCVTELAEGEYKFKKGFKTGTSHQKDEFFDDEVAAQERKAEVEGDRVFGRSRLGLRRQEDDRQSESGVAPRLTAANLHATVDRLLAAPPALGLSMSGPAMSPLAKSCRVELTSPLGVGHSRESHAPSSPVQDGTESEPEQVQVVARSVKRARSRSGSGVDAKSDGGSVAEQTPRKNKKWKKVRGAVVHGELVESGHQLLDDVRKQLSAEALWDRRIRNRYFETTLAKISSKATKLAHLVSNDAAAALSENLFNFATVVEEQRALFSELRSSPTSLPRRVSPRRTLRFSAACR